MCTGFASLWRENSRTSQSNSLAGNASGSAAATDRVASKRRMALLLILAFRFRPFAVVTVSGFIKLRDSHMPAEFAQFCGINGAVDMHDRQLLGLRINQH